MANDLSQTPPPILLQLLQTLSALVGGISLVLAIGVFLFWIEAEWSIRAFRERGIPLQARVMEKKQKRSLGGRGGGITTYTLVLMYSFYERGGRIIPDQGPPSGIDLSLPPTERVAQEDRPSLRVSHLALSRHVYSSSWNAVDPGDRVDILALPEAPEKKVLLRSFVDGESPRPLMLRPWFGFLCFIICAAGMACFKMLGGRF